MGEKDTGQEPEEGVRSRRVWEWAAIILAIVTGLWFGVTAVFNYWENRVVDGLRSSLTASKWNGFLQWQKTPLDFPEEYWEILPPLPPDLEADRWQLFKDYDRLVDKLRIYRLTAPGRDEQQYHRLIQQKGLSKSDTRLLQMLNLEMPLLMQRSTKLVNHPEYVLNDRWFYLNSLYGMNTRAGNLLEHYAYLLGLNDDWSSAIQCVELLTEFSKTDKVSGKGFNFVAKFKAMQVARNVTHMVTSRTSDSQVMRLLYKQLQEGRATVADIDPDLITMDLLILAEQQQLRLGLKRRPSRTYGELVEDYCLNISKLSRLLKAEVPAHNKAQMKELDAFSRIELLTLAPSGLVGPLQPVANRLNRVSALEVAMNYYKGNEKFAQSFRRHLAFYDLSLARLAGRIAELEGVPLTDLLPTVPEDPFNTGSVFKYNETQKEFYSIGPDRTDSTMDDLYDSRLWNQQYDHPSTTTSGGTDFD